MKIKNLYLATISGYKLPDDSKVNDTLTKYIEKEAEKQGKTVENVFTEEEKEELRKNIIEQLTKVSTQMRKISKIPALDNFIRSNSHLIDTLGKSIILKKEEFKKLIQDSNLNLGNQLNFINIMFDSKTKFCVILGVDKADLALALSENKITIEKYDTLMKQLDE